MLGRKAFSGLFLTFDVFECSGSVMSKSCWLACLPDRPILSAQHRSQFSRSSDSPPRLTRWTSSGAIEQCDYPSLIANPVVVPKKNGKKRVSIYFTNLNQACPNPKTDIPSAKNRPEGGCDSQEWASWTPTQATSGSSPQASGWSNPYRFHYQKRVRLQQCLAWRTPVLRTIG